VVLKNRKCHTLWSLLLLLTLLVGSAALAHDQNARQDVSPLLIAMNQSRTQRQ
jgi:hypothetical protein